MCDHTSSMWHVSFPRPLPIVRPIGSFIARLIAHHKTPRLTEAFAARRGESLR